MKILWWLISSRQGEVGGASYPPVNEAHQGDEANKKASELHKDPGQKAKGKTIWERRRCLTSARGRSASRAWLLLDLKAAPHKPIRAPPISQGADPPRSSLDRGGHLRLPRAPQHRESPSRSPTSCRSMLQSSRRTRSWRCRKGIQQACLRRGHSD